MSARSSPLGCQQDTPPPSLDSIALLSYDDFKRTYAAVSVVGEPFLTDAECLVILPVTVRSLCVACMRPNNTVAGISSEPWLANTLSRFWIT